MTEFLVEAYRSRAAMANHPPRAGDVSRAAEELTREGTPVRFLRTIFVPAEEICFYLYQANSVEAVREAAGRAGLTFERVTEAFTDGDREQDNEEQGQ
jgi:pyrrolidone-carboxylate peptidase